MSDIVHGRANHDPKSMAPVCICGAAGVKDPMWDRYYCPIDGVWLEGIYAACWCSECLYKSDEDPEDEFLSNLANEW